jgi:hypothetical protein
MNGLGRRQRAFHGVIGLAVLGGLLGGSDGGLGLLGSLGDLLGLGGGATPAASSAAQPAGSLHFDSQKLRKGCQRYSYSYQLTIPPGDDFDLEIFVTDPRGVSQGSDVILSGADPVAGAKSLTICRSNTVPGTFTLHGTLYTNDGAGPTTTTPLADDAFTLTAPKAHKKAHKHKKRRH